MEEPLLRSLVAKYLDAHLNENAVFLGERLVALHPSEQNRLLLATCHVREGQSGVKRAYAILRGATGPENRYLLATCCFKLDKLHEAERVLLADTNVLEKGLTACRSSLEQHPCPVPHGAAGLYLLGRICQRACRHSQASIYFSCSLSLDPFLWSSFEALCDMGEVIDVQTCFGKMPDLPPQFHKFATLGSNLEEHKSIPQAMPKTVSSDIAGRGFTVENEPSFAQSRASWSSSIVGSPSWIDTGPMPSAVKSPHPAGNGSLHQSGSSSGAYSYDAFTPGGSSAFGGTMNLRGELSAQSGPVGRLMPGRDFGGPTATPVFAARGGLFAATPNLTPITGGPHHSSIAATPHLTPLNEDVSAMEDDEEGKVAPASTPAAAALVTPAAAQSTPAAAQITPAAAQITPAMAGATPEPFGAPSGVPSGNLGPPSSFLSAEGAHMGRLNFGSFASPAGYRDPSSEKPCKIPKNDHATPDFEAHLETPAKAGKQSVDTPSSFRPKAFAFGGDTAKSMPPPPLNSTARPDATPQLENVLPPQAPASSDEVPGAGPARSPQAPVEVQMGASSADGTQAAQSLLSLLCVLGKAYQHLSLFQCKEAILMFHQLPPAQFNTGWVQHQVGRAYFELGDNANARQALEYMIRWDPHRLTGLDLLSTTLWHLRREVDLCYLAQRATDFDRLHPHTWCVVGNCFSLQKDPKTALRFFERAIQLDPISPYPHTLSGHEYCNNEEYDNAIACYRAALRINPRHYNAWSGLGHVYHQQEKYKLAEYHFKRALCINPVNTLLLCFLGNVQRSMCNFDEALVSIEGAISLDPSNPQAKFGRAQVLISQGRYEEALEELEFVRDAVPWESNVYFVMGKVYKELQQPVASMRHLIRAQDLRPKDSTSGLVLNTRLKDLGIDEEEKEWLA